MNIFYLDPNTKLCAEYHCDKHVVKMILEYAQMLSTAHRVLDGTPYKEKTAAGRNVQRWLLDESREGVLYKAAHVNHPSSVWVRKNTATYLWTYQLFVACLGEYTYRYGKKHKTSALKIPLSYVPENLPVGEWCEPPPAMKHYPQCIVEGDSLASYQSYYREAKAGFAVWTARPTPPFMSPTAAMAPA